MLDVRPETVPEDDEGIGLVDEVDLLDEVDLARAREYALISILLARAPDRKLLGLLSRLNGDASPLGRAHAALAEAAGRTDPVTVEREFFDLFVGLGRGELVPYASYYLTGFLHERPLARLRALLERLGIEATGRAEPEDHAAVLCEIMSCLVSRRLGTQTGSERELFDAHLSPWIGRFFDDLERASAADFYRHVGRLGRTFMDIEANAFAFGS